MKLKYTLLGLLLLFVAQFSFATYTYSYTSYYTTSVNPNGDGTYNLSTTATIDGTATGDCYYTGYMGQQQQIPSCNGATHTPMISNVIDDTIGGEQDGYSNNMFIYIHYTTTTSLNFAPGEVHKVSVWTKIKCMAVAAYILDTLFLDHFEMVAHTLSSYTGTASNCTQQGTETLCDFSVTANCTRETSPPTWNPTQIYDNTPALAGWFSAGRCQRVQASDPWTCIGIPLTALKTTQTTPFACTKLQ